MFLVALPRCFRDRHKHTWHKTDFYYKTVEIETCVRCDVPRTDYDRDKLEVVEIMRQEFGDQPQIPYWKLCTRAAQLLTPCIIKARHLPKSA